MNPPLRRITLTAHVTASVGWFGAVASFLVLAIAGLTREDPEVVRAAYVAMEVVGCFAVVPFCFASLGTGLVQALGTEWGLFRYYWVLTKLILTMGATVLLLVHLQPVGLLAGVAEAGPIASATYRGVRVQVAADAGAALAVLLVATVLSIYKPWGRTAYGHRSLSGRRMSSTERPGGTTWVWYALVALLGLAAALVLLHLNGALAGGHGGLGSIR